jgi:hypothetical protein
MTLDLTGGTGFGGVFGLIRLDPKGRVPGTPIEWKDMFEVGPDGALRVNPARAKVVQEVWVKNKWLKRGLGRVMHLLLSGHAGNTYAPSEIVNPTYNPFGALILVADHTVQVKFGDARVEWDESDGAYNSAIPTDVATPYEGRRGCALSDTSGIFKWLSSVYPSTTPYREIEYTFYASAVALIRAITGDPAQDIIYGPSDPSYPNSVKLANGSFTSDDIGMVLRIRNALNATNNKDRVIAQVWDATRVRLDTTVHGNLVAESTPRSFMDISFPDGVYNAPNTSGSAKAIDYFPIKGIGMARGVDAGDAETNSQWGVRSIIGFPPSFQGIADRAYRHEGTGLHQYPYSTPTPPYEDVNTYGDGYQESGHDGTYVGSNGFDGNVRQQYIDGVLDQGDKWVSADDSGPHVLGRCWQTAFDVRGVRVVMPPNVPMDYAPNKFRFFYLDPNANGGNPRPDYEPDWVGLTSGQGGDFTGSGADQGAAIYNAGSYGVEYTFTQSFSCKGFRIGTMTAYNPTRYAQLLEFYIWGYVPEQTFTKNVDKIALKCKTAHAYRTYYFQSDVSGAPFSVTNVCNALNPVLRGWQLEAIRTTFGFLVIRGTVAGSRSDAFIGGASEGSLQATIDKLFPPNTGGSQYYCGSDFATDFPEGPHTGVTLPVAKEPTEALAVVYRANISGDLSVTL